jgi:hypothetical protein
LIEEKKNFEQQYVDNKRLEVIMAEMGLGYGSEYQLLRFLGHHRDELEACILKNTRINKDLEYDIQWLDQPKDHARKSLDGEYKGIDFLPEETQEKISKNWGAYWPQTGALPNWDAVMYCPPIIPDSTLKEKWIIIEAKAHLQELVSSSNASEGSREKIEKAFEATQKRFNIKTQNSWLENYYQLANRLAFINFMLDNGIQCSLLNIYFLNGWEKNSDKNVLEKEVWSKKIDEEYSYLGINNDAKEYISEIFVEC